ncbi:uncharacterized protein DUF2786 [Murinocardiopsis flavida]|uniref:Uncharacterized protein DUF2786 n=1 Tax=Murinocardiopsis flavida TaxID=645275 RepID=A0A2P8CW31_9ACTN|nr:DUF2786 domain-containing protein [Murinocardiopsis flavida]PSK89182.1 uncharacterized protein DUF2786 [Murinocardiopsis flavida]
MGETADGRGGAPASGDDPYADAVGGALYALAGGDTAGFQRHTDRLTAGLGDGGDGVALLLIARLTGAVTRAWGVGWQPAEAVRQVGKVRGERHSRMAVDAVAAEMRRYPADRVDPQWSAQLADTGAAVWWSADGGYPREWALREKALLAEWVETAIEVLFELSRLPRIERLLPLPGEGTTHAARPTAGSGADAAGADAAGAGGAERRRMAARVRALLAKAEATEFPRESEAFTARAQELMARHSIDRAVLDGPGADGGPVSRRLPIDEPYDAAKALLLDAVAEANRCRAVWLSDLGMSTVVGYPGDLDAVELLFTSLLVQADTAMVAGEARQRAAGRGRTKTYRRSFLTSYAQRIGERLAAAAESARRQAAESAATDPLPVLASRDAAVGRAAAEMFPETVRSRVRGALDEAGWESGRAAADHAPLAGRRAVDRP